jgi:hypothetical protein
MIPNNFTLTEMKKVAKKCGGLCLSKKYISTRLALVWQCKKGHVWKASPSSVIKRQNWCPTCSGYTDTVDLKLLRKIAVDCGGLCLSKAYVSSTKKMRWQCSKGHLWQTSSAGIKRGYWCPECSGTKFSLSDIQTFAKKQKGVFISKKYKGYRVKHKWQCNKGHKFDATYESIKRRGYFCAKCKKILLAKRSLIS